MGCYCQYCAFPLARLPMAVGRAGLVLSYGMLEAITADPSHIYS